jgi:alkanesulfonate monooxygenase SsuD/methylene tetrahydromethanopterin reductase-like flavin-dependent oxidoreductase (luciferase family)
VDQTEEALNFMTRLWEGNPVDFQGHHYNGTGVQISPLPIQKPYPPLWFGTKGRRMLELTARFADAWIPTGLEPDEYRSKLEMLKSRRTELGLSSDIKPSLQHFTVFTDTDKFLANIKSFGDAGCRYYGPVWEYPVTDMVSRIKWFGREVKPYANIPI